MLPANLPIRYKQHSTDSGWCELNFGVEVEVEDYRLTNSDYFRKDEICKFAL